METSRSISLLGLAFTLTACGVSAYAPAGTLPAPEQQLSRTLLRRCVGTRVADRIVLPASPRRGCDFWNDLGVTCARHGHHGLALAAYARISAQQRSPVAHYNRGLAYYRLRLLDQAEVAFRRALDRRPRFAQAWNNLGLVLLKMRRHGEAEQALQSALRADRQHHRAWNNLGVVYTRIGRYDAAAAAFRTALDHAPDYGVARRNLRRIVTRHHKGGARQPSGHP